MHGRWVCGFIRYHRAAVEYRVRTWWNRVQFPPKWKTFFIQYEIKIMCRANSFSKLLKRMVRRIVTKVVYNHASRAMSCLLFSEVFSSVKIFWKFGLEFGCSENLECIIEELHRPELAHIRRKNICFFFLFLDFLWTIIIITGRILTIFLHQGT